MAILTPISQSFTINEQNNPRAGSLDTEDFSIIIHRIKQEDEIDPWGEAEWQLRMYVNGVKKTYTCEGDDVLVEKTFIWPDIIVDGMEFVPIKMELLEEDTWPNGDDIADISAFVDEDYEDGDYDNTDDFGAHRPAVFKRTYNLLLKEWQPVNINNDYLNTEYQPPFTWYITSGNYDGSTNVDENDATIWFNISVGNTPPYPPEKPSGPTFGWQGNIYDFSTKGYDIDGDRIQFGWDWDGDGDIDELTGFFGPWETCISPHTWSKGQIYYVKVRAIDAKGMPSAWSQPLKVRINAPGGINGIEIGEWSLGHIYCYYFDYVQTLEIINMLRSGGNIITALSGLITAISTALGIPVPYAVAFTVASALVRLGAEILNMLDKGMGIYLKVYAIEVAGMPIGGFGYIWSQSVTAGEGVAPQGNEAPDKPEKPSGEINIKLGREYPFSTVTTDPNDDRITYVYDWGDDNYSCSDLTPSGEKVSMSHSWEKSGNYKVRIKTLDEWGYESDWSDSLSITVTNGRQFTRTIFFNLLEKIIDHFPWLARLIRLPS